MSNTANFRSIPRTLSSLSIVLFAALLGACAHPPTNDVNEPKQWFVENVASKPTAELYAEWIKPAVFERSNSKIINGYTVESGKLRMPDKSDGALVTVRAADGGLTAFIIKPEQSGSLYVDGKGAGRFVPVSIADSGIEDGVPNPSEKVASAPVDPTSTQTYVIDLLMGYSRKGVERAGGDALRDALAKVEFFNMSLNNSLIENVSFKLVGIQIVEPDYQITTKNLADLPVIFAEGMAKSQPDLILGNFGSFEPSGAAGWAYTPGRTSIAISHDFLVAGHELAHNAGSSHCNVNSANDYRFGYFNGKSGSFLCGGNTRAYYSNPDLTDEHGLPRGDALTANTARVWRENAQRLSSYSSFVPTAPTGFAVRYTDHASIGFTWDQSPRAVKYEIWGRDNILLPPKKYGESTTTSGSAINVPHGLRPYHVVAIYIDGERSPASKIVYAEPYSTSK